MKIGLYDPYLDTIGGGEKYMMTIAESLSSDNTVEVFWDDLTIKNKLDEMLNLNLDKVKFVKNIFFVIYQGTIYSHIGNIKQVLLKIRKNPPDSFWPAPKRRI